MSLHLIATPIGHPGDLSARAIDLLKAADVVVGEERREHRDERCLPREVEVEAGEEEA